MTNITTTQKQSTSALFKVLASHGLEIKGGFAVMPVQSGIVIQSAQSFRSAVAQQLTPRIKLTKLQQLLNPRIIFVSFGSETKSEMDLLANRQAFMSVSEARKLGIKVGAKVSDVDPDTLRQRMRRTRQEVYQRLRPAQKSVTTDNLTL